MPENEKDYTDSLHRWHAQHEEWAKRQSIPPEQLAWCREQIEQAASAYQAGLDAGLNAGYRMGLTMGMQNGLAAAEWAVRCPDREELCPPACRADWHIAIHADSDSLFRHSGPLSTCADCQPFPPGKQ